MPLVQIPLRFAHNEGHTDVCYSCDGERYITCGSDGDIRIWSQDVYDDPIHKCVGESALAVRQVQDALYIATGSNDVQIITFPEGERKNILDRTVAPINNIAISKNGSWIALAGEEMVVKLIMVQDEQRNTHVFSDLGGPCLSVAICPNSELLAAASGDGKLRVWSMETKVLLYDNSCFAKVNSFANAKSLCRIDFEPKSGKYLAYPDKNNVIILNTSDWSQTTTLTCENVNEYLSIIQYSPCGNYLAASSLVGDLIIWNLSSELVHELIKHPNGTAVCAFMWNPTGTGEIVFTDIEGQLGVLTGCINNQKRDIPQATNGTVEDEMKEDNEVDFGNMQFEDDDDEDNENAVSLDKIKRQFADDDADPELEELRSVTKSVTPRPRTPEIPLQGPFMPSSTPEHLNPRYLCWNEVGVVRSYGDVLDDAEDGSKSIEVDFHDSNFHNSMMMQNYQNYTMGSLSSTAFVLANTGQVNVIPLGAKNSEWTLSMESGEEIVVIASSENLVCLGLANYLIRVCSSFGTQRVVVSMPGPLVSIAAFKNTFLVAYHSGMVRKGDQCINFKLVQLDGTNIEGKELGSTLGPESTLLWLGFTDCGTPAVLDSLGMLHLYPIESNLWMPLCNTAKHNKSPMDGFFVTAIFETSQTLVGIKCRGSVYPPVTPRPTMCEVPLEPPFAEMCTDKGQLESNLFTWSMLQVANTEKKFKETALKTFALACKTNLDQRALEVMEILNNPQIVSLGLRYATKLDKRRLVEKLVDLASKLSEEGDENNFSGYDVPTPDISLSKPVNRRLTLGSKSTPKSRNQSVQALDELSTPNPRESQEPPLQEVVTLNLDSTAESEAIKTQESLFSDGKKNPFLKSLKKKKPDADNPLSLTDKFAGVNYENKQKSDESVEKRKQPDSETEKQSKGKQRKLDKFMFSKRS